MSRSIQPAYFDCRYPFSEKNRLYGVALQASVIRIAKDAEKQLSLSEVKRRYEEFHLGKRPMNTRDQECYIIRNKLNDFSHFMCLFSPMTSFQHNRLCKRRGPIWQNRLESVIIESLTTLFITFKYVEFNSVQVKMAKDPTQ